MWVHPVRFNEYSPVRAADLNDLAADHELLLGDVARANLPIASPVWRSDLGGLYKDLAMWHRARYLWMRVTAINVSWWFTVNGVEVVRRQWDPGWVAEHTWTETIDLTQTNPNLVMGKMYDCRFEYEGVGGTPDWIHLKAIYQRESV